MSYSSEKYERRRRQATSLSGSSHGWGHWVPLAITVTIATAGIATWIWNERRHDDEDDIYATGGGPPGSSAPPGYSDIGPGSNYGSGANPGRAAGLTGSRQGNLDAPSSDYPTASATGFGSSLAGQAAGVHEPRTIDEEGLVSRMSGALRRTPSPQQLLDGASKRVAAGVAAAGAVVGEALASIREEDKRDYEDHSRWSEEAESTTGKVEGVQLQNSEIGITRSREKAASITDSKKRIVAIVISAESDYEHQDDAGYHQEHASILSHLPGHIEQTTRVFVLIYDPDITGDPLASGQKSHSMSSSFSNIAHEDAQSRDENNQSSSSARRSKTYQTLLSQAQTLVEKDTMIMPFTTPTGFVHMLRHIGPETVYVQATLAGSHGETIDQLTSWVGQIVIVVGDESGHGGLVDSEDERGEESRHKWWLDDPRIGLGKGIEVVDGLRVGEDFKRRVGGHD